MARAKKEAALTPEERLQAALVPDWEWPYKLPENWCWVILGKAVSLKRGASPRPIKKYITEEQNGVNWIKIGDTGDGKYITAIREKITLNGAQKSVYVKRGTLLLSNSMSFGRPYILSVDGCIHDGWLALSPTKALDKVYLYYALLASKWYFEQVAVGTAVRNLNIDRVSNTPVPIPPLAEQQRIVNRIESLFAKLDEAKEKAQAVVDSFETRKAAILHKAFTGELTANWREAHGVGMESWEKKYLKDVCQYMKAGGDKPTDFTDVKNDEHIIPVVANGIANDGIIGYTAEKKYDAGTVTISGRGTIGYSIYREYPIYPVVRLIVLCPKEELLPKYLKYLFDAFPEEGTGSSIPQLTVPSIKEKVIPVSLKDEQAEIVRILDDLFAKEQQAKEAAEAVLEKIDLMKKAILARAFRGELGTNDPTDEPAVELIKSILQQKIEQGNKPKKQEKKGNHKEENIVAKTILEVLTVQKRATPEALKKGTELDIDEFYDQVKALIASKAITETRDGNEVFLEVTHADRQVNN